MSLFSDLLWQSALRRGLRYRRQFTTGWRLRFAPLWRWKSVGGGSVAMDDSMWFDPVILNSLTLFCLVQSSVTLVQIYRFTGLNSPCKWFIGVGICNHWYYLSFCKIKKRATMWWSHCGSASQNIVNKCQTLVRFTQPPENPWMHLFFALKIRFSENRDKRR